MAYDPKQYTRIYLTEKRETFEFKPTQKQWEDIITGAASEMIRRTKIVDYSVQSVIDAMQREIIARAKSYMFTECSDQDIFNMSEMDFRRYVNAAINMINTAQPHGYKSMELTTASVYFAGYKFAGTDRETISKMFESEPKHALFVCGVNRYLKGQYERAKRGDVEVRLQEATLRAKRTTNTDAKPITFGAMNTTIMSAPAR